MISTIILKKFTYLITILEYKGFKDLAFDLMVLKQKYLDKFK